MISFFFIKIRSKIHAILKKEMVMVVVEEIKDRKLILYVTVVKEIAHISAKISPTLFRNPL